MIRGLGVQARHGAVIYSKCDYLSLEAEHGHSNAHDSSDSQGQEYCFSTIVTRI